MATPYLGRGAVIGWGEETTWGTPVSRTNWMPVVSMSASRKLSRTPRPHLVGASSALVRRAAFTAEDRSSGSFEMELRYRGIGTWLKHALGTVATTGTGPYVHTLTLGELPISATPGLTLEMLFGSAPNSEVFEGVLVDRMVISQARGDVARLKVDWIAQQSAARSSAGSPTLPTVDEPVLHSQFGQLSFNSVSYDLIDFTLSLGNNQAVRQLLGSAQTAQPVVSDFREITLQATLEFADDNLYDAQLATTQGDVAFTATGVGNSVLAFTLQNAEVEAADNPVSGPGIITRSVTWRGYSDGTDEGLKLILTNDDSDVDAAA